MTSNRNIPNAAWITWEIQVRNRSMARALDIPIFELTSDFPRIVKYPLLIVRTIRVILGYRVKLLFVQNPSIVLSFLAICMKPILGLTVIVDAHNSGIFPLEGRSRILNFIARAIVKSADYVIVTNSYIGNTVKGWKGRPMVIPDPIPILARKSEPNIELSRPFILFICTWADDEPFHEVISAGALLQKHHIDLWITGNYKKKLPSEFIKTLPENVKLIGFVDEETYVNCVANARAVIDLTTRENCLVCGAYEAAALGTPAIISDTVINREVFYAGYVYTNNTSIYIAQAVVECLSSEDQLRHDLGKFKLEHDMSVNKIIEEFKQKLFCS